MDLKQAKTDKSLGVFPFIKEKGIVQPLQDYFEMAQQELIKSMEKV